MFNDIGGKQAITIIYKNKNKKDWKSVQKGGGGGPKGPAPHVSKKKKKGGKKSKKGGGGVAQGPGPPCLKKGGLAPTLFTYLCT